MSTTTTIIEGIIPISIIAGMSELRLIREELQIMNCGSQYEKNQLRAEIKEQRKNETIGALILIGIGVIIPAIIEMVRKAR